MLNPTIFYLSKQPILNDFSGCPHLLTNVLATFVLDTVLTVGISRLFSKRNEMPHTAGAA
jgi:hypothetical protein